MDIENLYNVRLNPFQKPRRGWDVAVEKEFPSVHIWGADVDHGTLDIPPGLVGEVTAFLAPEFRVEKNTDGSILCDMVDLSL